MKNSQEKNIETIKLKDVPETKKSNDYEIPSNINSYFQSIDLKDLASYQDNIFEEINNSDTLFGNNYFKYFMKNKLLPKKSCFKERPKKLGNLYSFLFIRNQPLFLIGTKKLYLVIIYQSFLSHFFIFGLKNSFDTRFFGNSSQHYPYSVSLYAISINYILFNELFKSFIYCLFKSWYSKSR